MNSERNSDKMVDYLKEEKEQILEKICSAKKWAEQVAVCADFYEMVQKEEPSRQGVFFGWFLSAADRIWFQEDSDEENVDSRIVYDKEVLVKMKTEKLSRNDLVAARLKYARLVQGLIDVYSNVGYTAYKYYTTLWASICAIPGVTSRAEKGSCIYAVVIDMRTPYFQVEPGIHMNNRSYLEVARSIEPEIAEMQFILALRSHQRTETASRLLSVLEGLDSTEKKTVFLSQLIAAVESDDS